MRIAITPGEPAGIGPELLVRLAQQSQSLPCELVAVASGSLLQATAESLGLPLHLHPFQTDRIRLHQPGHLSLITSPLGAPVTPGQLNPANAAYVLNTLQLATDACLNGSLNALVTGPVQKSVINEAGIPFSGHTEFLAQRSGNKPVVMMLATEGLRVALATTHLPLKDVSAAITPSNLTTCLRILHQDLQQHFGLANPRILVCGLNPHAGESGHMGREEIDTLEPVIRSLQAEGFHLEGPLPADTLFTPKYLNHADAVLAMYHDQGLPVLKYKGFGQAVNITLGLPFIRTSVDHGTALTIAGTGTADLGSLNTALGYAQAMVQAQARRAEGVDAKALFS